ncbi:MAG TPA: sigma-70 family RNA polymerase sigma factor [Planctomycetaceae bacterium]|nr:sigma-70 family RNA polymerase sigma factor [Planctomycetaceae bacterium]
MSGSGEIDRLLVERVRKGDESAWQELIDIYEGRLLAYAEARVGRGAAAEDIVQETFLGLLNSLPNYDGTRPLENYLFSICGYKVTDHLRREGRRPTLPMTGWGSSERSWEPAGWGRRASSIARSGERRGLEEETLRLALSEQIDKWLKRGDWNKLKCIELLFVRGWPNKRVAETLGLTEQQVANYKSDFVSRTRTLIRRQRLPEDVFPELF